MKIYLAGPMRGYPNFNFDRFDADAAVLRLLDHHVFSPAERDRSIGFDGEGYLGDEDLDTEGFDLRAALADDLAYIAEEADAVAVLPSWHQSAGARAEVCTARALGLPVLMVGYSEDGIAYVMDISTVAYREVS